MIALNIFLNAVQGAWYGVTNYFMDVFNDIHGVVSLF